MNRRTNSRGGCCVFGIFAVLGSIFLVVALAFWTTGSRFRSTALHTQGTVIRMVTHEDSEGGHGHIPVVQYSVGTQTYDVEGTVSSSPPAYHVGETVKILYQPGKPDAGQIDSFIEQGFLPLIFGGIGGIFFVIGSIGGVVSLLFGRR